ncbi:MAG: carbohydrate porin [Rhodospirillales bacterium]
MAGLLLAGSGMPAAAETMDEWLSGDYATGDWGGMRTQLEEMGITPEITYTTDILTLLKGGVDDGNGSSYAGRAELNLNFDLEKLFGLQGSRFYIEGAWSSGQDISARHIGNLFPAAQIFTGNGVRLSEMYFEQNLFDGKVSLALGRMTTENDFLASTIYENYVNGGINGTPFGVPSGQPGFTTNPFTQWGFRADYYPIEQIRAAVGIYNANDEVNANKEHGVDFSLDLDDGVMTVGEVDFLWNQKEEEGGLPGVAKAGFVYDNGRQPQLPDEETDKGNNYSFYASIEQMVYRESDDPKQGLTPWAVVTYSPRESLNINPVFVGTGLVYQGLIPTRDDDVAAIGFYYGKVSNRIEDASSEKLLELAYTAQITPWFYVRPDFQYIFDPSGDASIDNAIVFGGEISIVF